MSCVVKSDHDDHFYKEIDNFNEILEEIGDDQYEKYITLLESLVFSKYISINIDKFNMLLSHLFSKIIICYGKELSKYSTDAMTSYIPSDCVEVINKCFKECLLHILQSGNICSLPKLIIYYEIHNIISISLNHCKDNNNTLENSKRTFIENMFKYTNEILTLMVKISQKCIVPLKEDIYEPIITKLLNQIFILAKAAENLALILAVTIWKIYFNLYFGNFEALLMTYDFTSVLDFITTSIIQSFQNNIFAIATVEVTTPHKLLHCGRNGISPTNNCIANVEILKQAFTIFPLFNAFFIIDLDCFMNMAKEEAKLLAQEGEGFDGPEPYFGSMSLAVMLYRATVHEFNHTPGAVIDEGSCVGVSGKGRSFTSCIYDLACKTSHIRANLSGIPRAALLKEGNCLQVCHEFPTLPFSTSSEDRLVQIETVYTSMFGLSCLRDIPMSNNIVPNSRGSSDANSLATLVAPLLNAVNRWRDGEHSCGEGDLTNERRRVSISVRWLYLYARLLKEMGANDELAHLLRQLLRLNRFLGWYNWMNRAQSKDTSALEHISSPLTCILKKIVNGGNLDELLAKCDGGIERIDLVRYLAVEENGSNLTTLLSSASIETIFNAATRVLEKLRGQPPSHWSLGCLFTLVDVLRGLEPLLRSILSQIGTGTVTDGLYKFVDAYFSIFPLLPWKLAGGAIATTEANLSAVCQMCCLNWLDTSKVLYGAGQKLLKSEIEVYYQSLLEQAPLLDPVIRVWLQTNSEVIVDGSVSDTKQTQVLPLPNFALDCEDSDGSQNFGNACEIAMDETRLEEQILLNAQRLYRAACEGRTGAEHFDREKMRSINDTLMDMIKKC